MYLLFVFCDTSELDNEEQIFDNKRERSNLKIPCPSSPGQWLAAGLLRNVKQRPGRFGLGIRFSSPSRDVPSVGGTTSSPVLSDLATMNLKRPGRSRRLLAKPMSPSAWLSFERLDYT